MKNQPFFEYKVIDSLEDIQHIKPDVETFGGIKTNGFYINTRLIQLYQPTTNKTVVYILDTDILCIEDIKMFLKPKWLVWYDGSYAMGTLNISTKIFDTLSYLVRTAYPEWKAFGFDTVTNNLGWDIAYKGLDKKVLGRATYAKGVLLDNNQLRYAATDVYVLAQLWKNIRVQKVRSNLSYRLDILSLKYSIAYQQNGLVVYQPAVHEELKKVIDLIDRNNIALNGLNPNSPKQVCIFLGTSSSSKEVLVELIAKKGSKADMAKLIYEQRRLLKRRTFLDSYNHPTVVTRFNPAGATTGRFTSTGKDLPRGINAQQITRNLQYIFNKDTEDTVVIHADYSTAELRAGCSIMRDFAMYKDLMAGKDLHKIAATFALGGNPENITKTERQKGKSISFGFIFGMSPATFVKYAFTDYNVIFTLDEAKAIKAAYAKRYPQIAKYAQDRWNDYKTGLLQTPLGRRSKARLGTDAINYATQGCIAETMKLAVHFLCAEFPEATTYFYNVVHDSGFLRVPKGSEVLWAKRLVLAMKKGWVEMCKRPMLYYKDIPMPVEVEYNDYSSGKAKYTCIKE